MYLRCYRDENGKKAYTMKKHAADGEATASAHPAKFSPHDKYSEYRVSIKRRFKLLRKSGHKKTA